MKRLRSTPFSPHRNHALLASIHRALLAMAVALTAACSSVALAADSPAGIVSHVKVVSDKVQDVSSLQAWKKSFIKDSMNDQEKAMAVWESLIRFRQQDAPPGEGIFGEGCAHDVIKTMNVYGYGMCCCASANISSLSRYLGLQARGWAINAHSVPEVFYDDSWHMLDASLLTYFPRADGKAASVEEIVAGVQGWLKEHPDTQGDKALRQFMGRGGWRKGPEILARSPFYDDNGWLPAATHGWYATMQEYNCKPFIYEYGYSQGYEVNIQLRPGERLVRNWSNKGLHVNMKGDGGKPGCLTGKVGQGDLRWTPRYGDLAPGRVGNGTHEYAPPASAAAFKAGCMDIMDVNFVGEDKAGRAVILNDGAPAGSFVVRMPSSYVYLTGELSFQAVVGQGGAVKVEYSENNGLDWKEIARAGETGRKVVDLSPLTLRKYDYRLRFVLSGAGTGLGSLRIMHDIQHSQRALPALAQGKNTISFSAGAPEGTITCEGNTHIDAKPRAGAMDYRAYKAQLDGLDAKNLRPGSSGKGSATFTVNTPGDLSRLRFGGFYRARDAKDGYDLQVSFDGGKTFKTIDRMAGPVQGSCKYVVVNEVPAGLRTALVRYAGQQRNTTCLFHFRIDADYREPAGAMAPIKVTYVWEEDGAEKRDVHVTGSAEEQYTIQCAGKPLMRSIVLERAE